MSREKVLEFINRNEENIIDFLKRMISIRSDNPGADIEGPKETEIQDYLEVELKKYGLAVDKFTADKEGKRPNICAVLKGNGTGRDLILNAHVDTVIVSEPEKWDYDPFVAKEVEGKIFGRGANDMKGGLASALWAVKAVKDCGIELGGDVILQFVAGEESCEGGTIGTAACIKRGYKAPFAIVAEPTSNEIHNTTASLLCFELIVPGKAVHTCCRNQVIFPQSCYQDSGSSVGVDAVEKALPFLDFFYKLEKQWNFRWKSSDVGTGGKPLHDAQGVGVFNINPSFIEAGTYIAAVASSVKVTYALWHPAEIDASKILEEIRERVHALAQTDDWLRENPPVVNGPVSQLWPGFVTPEDSEPVVMMKKAINTALNREAIISGFRAVCDGTYLDEAGISSVVCGPGAINDGAHGDNEFVRRSEVIDAAKIYASFILDWCK